MNIIIYSVKDLWTKCKRHVEYQPITKKIKNPKRLESAKKKKTHFWKSFNYIEFGYETEGGKGWKCLFKRQFSNVLTLFLGMNSISVIIETRSYVCTLGVGVFLSRHFARNRGRGIIIVICRNNIIVTQTVARKYNIILHLPIVLYTPTRILPKHYSQAAIVYTLSLQLATR